ncbi:MAG: hypothetical protein ACRDRG_14325 [Pseudonocardiaceae bacterium]
MGGIQSQIEQLLRDRVSQLPSVRAELDRWSRVDGCLTQLALALEELRTHPKTPVDTKAGLAFPQLSEFRREIAEVIDLFRVAEARFLRTTINIGVSGVARVGKSTLLQSLSGLNDDQIPTGSGIPVTAVRSRIYHSSVLRRAVLRLHTVETFLDEVVGPYHNELGISARPINLQEFRAWEYPRSSPDGEAQIETRRRLQDMQRSLESYEKDLIGGELTIDDLRELRPYVAYPTNEELESTHPSAVARRYLAVKDVRIDTRFPNATIEQLGLVDLPGLGEIAVNAEQRHLAGLRNEVDVVLLVKRPVEGMAFWGKGDKQTLALIDEARGFIRDRRSFVFLVINAGSDDLPHLVRTLHDDIRRQLNDGQDGRFITVLTVDAASEQSAAKDLLTPLLQNLVQRLPLMDRQVLDGTRARAASLSASIRAGLADVDSTVTDLHRSGGSSIEDLELRSAELRKDLAVDLTSYVQELLQLTRAEQDDAGFIEAVEAAYRNVVSWIEAGFDEGHDVWCHEAVRAMIADKNSAPFAAAQMSRVRVEIGKRFAALDDFFAGRLHEVWGRLADILRTPLGELLDGYDGRLALEQLVELLRNASEPCPAFTSALSDILSIRLEYRTQLYPKVRFELGSLLNLEVINPTTGEPEKQITVPLDKPGAERLYRFISSRSRQAAHLIKKSLLQEAVAPSQVIHAFVEQFEDAMIRSGAAEQEFRRLARSYRDEIWPGVYQGIDEDNARVARVIRASRALSACMDVSVEVA